MKTIDLTQLAFDPAPSDQIGPGDVIEVSVAGGIEEDSTATFAVRVNEAGDAVIPLVGPVPLNQLTLQEAEVAIKYAFREKEIFRDPHVAVLMKQQKTAQVVVVGAVEKEGSYELPEGSSGLLQAISMAGGLSDDAGTHVEIRYPARSMPKRDPLVAQADGGGTDGGETGSNATASAHSMVGLDVPVQNAVSQTVNIDLASLSKEEPSKLELPDGAIVSVERLDPAPIQVMGLVNKPQVYDFPMGKNLHLLDAIAMAEGTSSLVADKVLVIRRRPEEPVPALIQCSMDKAKQNGAENLLLEPGDTVLVEQTPTTVFLETIRMIGFNVSAFAFR